jgi:hypothetical protein
LFLFLLRCILGLRIQTAFQHSQSRDIFLLFFNQFFFLKIFSISSSQVCRGLPLCLFLVF